MREAIRENWKTAIAGLAILFLGAGFLMKLISLQEFLGGFALVSGGGFLAARDASNGKKPPTKPDGQP